VWAGLPADIGVAAAAFIGTNLDNGLVTAAMVAAAPPERDTRIVVGQVIGFTVLVAAAAGTALALFEVSARVIGLLGLVPLALGLRGLLALRHPEDRWHPSQRVAGTGILAAMLVTIGSGGDNLAIYIPLFRVAGAANLLSITAVFVAGELLLTAGVLRIGRHPRTRGAVTRIGVWAAPVLYCLIGVLVLVRAGTLSFLG
jgi:cadmium resistance protein CadD (predicted permease)